MLYVVYKGQIKINTPPTFNESLVAERGYYDSDLIVLKYPQRWTGSVYIFKHSKLTCKYTVIDEAKNHYVVLRFSKLERELEKYEQYLKSKEK